MPSALRVENSSFIGLFFAARFISSLNSDQLSSFAPPLTRRRIPTRVLCKCFLFVSRRHPLVVAGKTAPERLVLDETDAGPAFLGAGVARALILVFVVADMRTRYVITQREAGGAPWNFCDVSFFLFFFLNKLLPFFFLETQVV